MSRVPERDKQERQETNSDKHASHASTPKQQSRQEFRGLLEAIRHRSPRNEVLARRSRRLLPRSSSGLSNRASRNAGSLPTEARNPAVQAAQRKRPTPAEKKSTCSTCSKFMTPNAAIQRERRLPPRSAGIACWASQSPRPSIDEKSSSSFRLLRNKRQTTAASRANHAPQNTRRACDSPNSTTRLEYSEPNSS
jgi:hypothetical protein